MLQSSKGVLNVNFSFIYIMQERALSIKPRLFSDNDNILSLNYYVLHKITPMPFQWKAFTRLWCSFNQWQNSLTKKKKTNDRIPPKSLLQPKSFLFRLVFSQRVYFPSHEVQLESIEVGRSERHVCLPPKQAATGSLQIRNLSLSFF